VPAGQARFRIDIERSRSGDYLFLVTNSHTTSEIRYLRASNPLGEFKLVSPREDNHEYYLDHHPSFGTDGDTFLIRTNSLGRTFRLVAAPASDPQRNNWRELVPNRPAVMLSAVAAFRTHLAFYEREGGLPYLRIAPLAPNNSSLLDNSHRIEFSEPAYNASLGADFNRARRSRESTARYRSARGWQPNRSDGYRYGGR
jgi:oligopeptidase B